MKYNHIDLVSNLKAGWFHMGNLHLPLHTHTSTGPVLNSQCGRKKLCQWTSLTVSMNLCYNFGRSRTRPEQGRRGGQLPKAANPASHDVGKKNPARQTSKQLLEEEVLARL